MGWKMVKNWFVFVAKLQEMGTYFEKIPKLGYLFLEKLPIDMGITYYRF